MIYRPYKLWCDGILKESWEPGSFVYDREINTIHRLDCGELSARDPHDSVFLDSFGNAIGTGVRPCPKCEPKPRDSYRQCLICGAFIATDRGVNPSVCPCGELEVDPSPPGLVRLISKSNRMLSRHVSSTASS